MFDEIDAKFNIRGKPVIFAWGDTIFNPQDIDIPPALIAHEEVHGVRQTRYASIEQWWRDYINDPVFRLAEEIPAHMAEYAHMTSNGNRNIRRLALKSVARRLASPLYGRIINAREAREILKGHVL